jgi:hypothetical protein
LFKHTLISLFSCVPNTVWEYCTIISA